MTVQELMSPAVIAVGPKTPLRDVLLLMLKRHVNNVVIVDAEQIPLGIVTYHDLSRKLLPTYEDLAEHEEYIQAPQSMEDRVTDIAKIPVEDIMTKKLITVSPDLEVLKAGATLIAHRIKQLPVVRDHKVVGIISHSDIAWGLMMQYPECFRA